MSSDLRYAAPELPDASAMWQIARDIGLDQNSPYKYLVFCRDFRGTSTIARDGAEPVGFVTGYLRPAAPDTLFVWQIGVVEKLHGRGIAHRMLDELATRLAPDVRYLEASITPDNAASNRLFTRFAERRDAHWERAPLFDSELFPYPHPDEVLIRIGPFRRALNDTPRI
ncbi:MAG TPA: diaminobutyrate acetyltransferase [Mycobacteriales bacterium]|jgi:L-2,4-diaminobutyric acid acetyltransferase|nr:diaminobutyrate acetyltransferase [Mycobacteriales bacterium]